MTATLNFEALFDASPYPYLAVAVDWTIIGANPAYLTSVKRTADELIGRQLFEVFPANASDPASTGDDIVRASIETAITTKQPHTTAFVRYAVPVKTAEGTTFEPRYWSTVHTPVLGDDGEVAFVIQNAIDVTAMYEFAESSYSASLSPRSAPDSPNATQAQTHQALMRILKAERNHLLGLFNQAPGFIAVLRGPLHIFELVNEAYYQLLGHREIVGKPLREALPDLMGQGFEELLDNVYATGKPFVGKGIGFKAQRVPNGPFVELYIDLLYQPVFDVDGSVSGIFAQGQDVTEIYLANRALKDADRRKDEFLAMLAHELRNPLAPISATAELLPLVADEPGRVRSAAATVRKQVKHLSGLLDDLLDVSRVTSGMIELELTLVNVVDVLIDAEEQVRANFERRSQVLAKTYPTEPLFVTGDQKRLVQVLANLLGNAAKYSGENAVVTVSIIQKGTSVEFEVRDSGMGIESDFLPYVFDLFAQSKRSSARSEGGLGLGLSIVKSLVELHSGAITAESDGPNLGSRFLVTLPLALEHKSELSNQMGIEQSGENVQRRVLVVDDNVDAAELTAEFLTIFGHRVDVAFDAEGALALADEIQFDACILDIGLPGYIDGNALAKKFRNMPNAKDALLIAVTGYADPADRQRGEDAGFDYYFAKPADMQHLLKLVTAGRHGLVGLL